MKVNASTQTTSVTSLPLADPLLESDPLLLSFNSIIHSLRTIEEQLLRALKVAPQWRNEAPPSPPTVEDRSKVTGDMMNEWARLRLAAMTTAIISDAEQKILDQLGRITLLVPHGESGAAFLRAKLSPARKASVHDGKQPTALISPRERSDTPKRVAASPTPVGASNPSPRRAENESETRNGVVRSPVQTRTTTNRETIGRLTKLQNLAMQVMCTDSSNDAGLNSIGGGFSSRYSAVALPKSDPAPATLVGELHSDRARTYASQFESILRTGNSRVLEAARNSPRDPRPPFVV